LSETFHILRRIHRDSIMNVQRSSHKVPAILVRSQWNLNFLNRFSKNTEIVKFHKNLSIGSRVVPQGHDEGHSRFLQFCGRA
jgi:hypothetical protein